MVSTLLLVNACISRPAVWWFRASLDYNWFADLIPVDSVKPAVQTLAPAPRLPKPPLRWLQPVAEFERKSAIPVHVTAIWRIR